MIVEDSIVSDDLALACFCCDLQQCHGACCVEGDSGAPLDEEELATLESIFPKVRPYMAEAGIAVVEQQGVAVRDAEGSLGTPLVAGRECAYAIEENGLTLCAIEKAYRDGVIEYQKPVSCHLYPVRVEDFGEFRAVNYHRWDVCRCAVQKGRETGVPLYQYLKEPLIRRFGEAWYEELCEEIAARRDR